VKRELRRIAVLVVAGFTAYKVTVAAFAHKIPGQPFYDFDLGDWLAWALSPSELAFILAALCIDYALLFFVTRRLSTFRLAAWGGLMGPYLARVLFPFDLLTIVDELPDQYWPSGLPGAALELCGAGALLCPNGLAYACPLAAVEESTLGPLRHPSKSWASMRSGLLMNRFVTR
jgi:hypothetical protein